ncbi:MAG TPA: tryptophan 7-halogenase, partial [Solirubrobacteraceae bacterium]|nr:tryptophan 7-halogenase [Solirubrobacteraceae bacterium]
TTALPSWVSRVCLRTISTAPSAVIRSARGRTVMSPTGSPLPVSRSSIARRFAPRARVAPAQPQAGGPAGLGLDRLGGEAQDADLDVLAADEAVDDEHGAAGGERGADGGGRLERAQRGEDGEEVAAAFSAGRLGTSERRARPEERAMSQQRIGEHAIVIGAGVAGLLAARGLSDAYERVTVIERDELPTVGEGRKAVPQGRHAHVMLARGLGAIEELLPGITEELLAAAAKRCKSGEIRLVISGHELCRNAPGADVLLASRPLIEGHVRQRVLALPNVMVRERFEAAGPVASPGRGRVSAVRIRPATGVAARRCAPPI